MLNSHCNNNDKNNNCYNKNNKKKIMRSPRFEFRIYGSKTTVESTTLWRPMELIDKNNQYMLKL